MKKLMMVTLFLLSFFSVSAVEDIEKLMVEKAETPQEKKAIHKYLMKEAAERKKMAARMRDMANTKKGGKKAAQSAHKKEMLEEADALDKIAKDYEELAEKVKD